MLLVHSVTSECEFGDSYTSNKGHKALASSLPGSQGTWKWLRGTSCYTGLSHRYLIREVTHQLTVSLSQTEKEIYGIHYFLTVCAKLSQPVPQDHGLKLACSSLRKYSPFTQTTFTLPVCLLSHHHPMLLICIVSYVVKKGRGECLEEFAACLFLTNPATVAIWIVLLVALNWLPFFNTVVSVWIRDVQDHCFSKLTNQLSICITYGPSLTFLEYFNLLHHFYPSILK